MWLSWQLLILKYELSKWQPQEPLQQTEPNLEAITKTRLFTYFENFTTIKIKNFQIKNPNIYHISAQNIDYGYSLDPPRRGGSNEYPQPMFWTEIRKKNVYPCKPQFYYIKVGFKGSNLYRRVFVMNHPGPLHLLTLCFLCKLTKVIVTMTIESSKNG